MISILIPCYNDDPEELIVQLLEQNKFDSLVNEIIVYDDCSITPLNLRRDDLSLIKTIRGSSNKGSLIARKILADYALNKDILFLDADLKLISSDFLNTFASYISKNFDVVHAGIRYDDESPSSEFLLRWTYGKKREERRPEHTENNYDSFVSAAFLTTKEFYLNFLKSKGELGYGSDILITSKLKKDKAKTLFIDNPVIHNGLDTNEIFLEKSLKAIETTVLNEKLSLIPPDHRPVQKAAQIITKYRLTALVKKTPEWIIESIKYRLVHSKPNLLLLDFIKLHYYLINY